MNIFETLKELSDNQRKKESSKRKDPSYIYLDKDNQVKEIPLSKLDSVGSALIIKSKSKFKSPAKLIHDSIFGLID